MTLNVTAQPLGRLRRLEDIRTVWPNEAQNFTPWLAEDDSLALLGETIGMELEFVGREQWVGPFRADLLCSDSSTHARVLIENQFGKTDHSHLGQLITYAAGLEAVTIVWIAERFTDEHRAALDWLNRSTAEGVNFFGLEVELWQIGSSMPAPKFNVVSQPNDWLKATTEQAEALTGTDQLKLAYWQAFVEYAKPNAGPLSIKRPQAVHWMDFSVGRSGFWVGARINTQKSILTVGLYSNLSKDYYRQLLLQKDEIEAALGFPMMWTENLGKKQSQVELRLEVPDVRDDTTWGEQHAWFLKHLQALHRVFSPRIKVLQDIPVGPGDEGALDEDEA
ncbi:hypothetical protein DEIGR_320142 [Deinococcus grandis]|uniref:DUF4268 domain-containing protein n=1 Tax=Deinococcus grandis TaxID=57498 RepID=A0A100HN11_9DEIO|nr:DUF4268 domain-containing protein [Deinococcus grandis]BBN96996.1 hypothetical protein DEGR_37290 [Deinococcus grandis]GAQ23728.1 hypothetical protein DEIGR_320142 [Deinococcus grandis]